MNITIIPPVINILMKKITDFTEGIVNNLFEDRIKVVAEYNLFVGLVSNNFKGRYSNSIFGYLWHVINPLIQILIYYMVFSQLMGRDIENYWVYLSVGVFSYNFFSSALNAGTGAITSQRNMITKMSFPREVLVFSSVGVSLITFVISYSILIALIGISGLIPNPWTLLLVPFVIIMETIFVTGLSLASSALNVYYRDVSYGIHILTMMLMFLTPIFYMGSMGSNILEAVQIVNPICYYVEAFHDIIYFGTVPDIVSICVGVMYAVFVFIAGLMLFKRLEKRFAEKL